MTATTAAATKATIEESGHESDGSLTWEDFFGSTTAEDLVPTLLSMYDRLVGRGGPAGQSGGCRSGGGGQQQASQLTRPPEPPPPPPPPSSVPAAADLLASPRPLSQTSISSSSSSSSSGGGTLCKRQAFLASIESLEDSGEEEERGAARGGGSSRSSPPSKAGSQGSEDSGVYSPRSCVSSPGGSTTAAEERGGGGGLGAGGRLQGGPPRSDLQLSYTDRVVLEIVETEQVYVHHLSQVIHGYIEQLETSSNCPISKSDLHDLFGNIRQIFTFNSTFLRELEECGMDPVRVAQVFVRNNCGFSVYTHYCTNYPRAVGVLTSLMRDERVVRLFRERQASLGHTLPLGSYLLKPVQRILKYHLLLQNIVKNGSEREAGYYDLVTALSTMTGIAQHINDMKRKHEHAVRVQEIQSLLIGWQGEDLTRYGELCAEGTFRMAGAKALRHAFLFDQILLITKKKEEGILQYKAHIMCSNLMLIESIPGEPLCFHVIPFDNPRHQYTLQARSLEQKREWSLQLKRVILENYNAVIPSHARQLVMELGQTRTDEELLSERGGGQSRGRQHSAPEYLERRKQEQRRKSSTEGGVFRCRLQRASRVRKSDLSPSHLKEKLRLRRSVNSRGDDSLRTSTESKLDSCGSEEGCVGSPLRSGTPGGEGGSATPCESPATSRRPLPPPPEEDGASSPLTDRRLPSNPATPPPESISPVEPPPRCPENGQGVAEPQSTPTKAEEKKKTIEEIVSQLLMQNKEFQRVLKKQRHITSRRCRAETSEDDDDDEDEDEGLSPSVTGSSVSSLNSISARRVLPSGLLASRRPQDPDYDNLWSTAAAEIKRTRSFTGGGGEREGSSSEISLSGSRDSFGGPTCPAVWLKQQHQHLVVTVASTKAGSLPRGFQLGGGGPPSGSATSDCWARHRVSPDRPFTIASDKAAELNLEEMERYCEEAGSGAALLLQRQRFPLPPDETEDESTPDQSTSDLLHPEHRVYRPSLTRATIKQVISSVSQKLAGLRAASSSNETLDQSGSMELGGPGAEGRGGGGGGGRLRQAFSRTFRHSGRAAEEEKTEVARRLVAVGSRTVGARMANVSSDYADPRTLFPTITRSRKAASLLGIRPYSADLPSSASSSSGYTGSCSSSQLRTEENGESDGSTDSFYERSFDAIESTLSEACRDSAVFSESEELTPTTTESGLRTAGGGGEEHGGGGGSPRKRKVPPPVPDKPPSLLRLPRSASELASRCSSEFGRSPSEFCVRSLSELSPRQPPATAPSTPGDEDYDSSSVASTVIESSSCTSSVSAKGWVKQVVCKIQGDQLL